MRAADRLRARFGQTKVLHLAFLNQIFDSARNILVERSNRHECW